MAKQQKPQEQKPESTEPEDTRKKVMSMTADSVGKDLLQAFVIEMKLMPDPWAKLPKAKQDDVLDRLRARVEDNVKMAVHLIASEGRSVIVGDCKKVNIGDDVKAEFVVSRRDNKAFHDLCEAQGKSCLLVVASHQEHTVGMNDVQGESDQRAMDLGHEYDPKGDGKGMDTIFNPKALEISYMARWSDEEREAYGDGQVAAQEGQELDDCPYDSDDLKARWVKGFEDWQAEHTEPATE